MALRSLLPPKVLTTLTESGWVEEADDKRYIKYRWSEQQWWLGPRMLRTLVHPTMPCGCRIMLRTNRAGHLCGQVTYSYLDADGERYFIARTTDPLAGIELGIVRPSQVAAAEAIPGVAVRLR